MSFAIYRTKKLKSAGEIAGSLSHTYRTRETLNADQNRSHMNENSISTYSRCFQSIKNAIPEKHRKDAVLCIEHLITASPDFFKNIDLKKENDFFKKSLEFIKEKYGEKNVISHSIHRDETTPHLIVYVVPVDEKTGKLNAKKWLGGKAKLSQTQTEFANHVSEFGLERGLERSKARHKTIKEFYAEIQKPTPVFKNYSFKPLIFNDLPKIGLLETTSSYAKKLESAYSEIKEHTQKSFDKRINELNNKHKAEIDTYEVKLRNQIAKTDQLDSEVMRLYSYNSMYSKEIEKQKTEKTLLETAYKKQIDKIEREYSNISYVKQNDRAFFMELDKYAFQRAAQIKAEKEQKIKLEREQREREQREHAERSRLLEIQRREKELHLQHEHKQFVLNRKNERLNGGYINSLNEKYGKYKNDETRLALSKVVNRRIYPEPFENLPRDTILHVVHDIDMNDDLNKRHINGLLEKLKYINGLEKPFLYYIQNEKDPSVKSEEDRVSIFEAVLENIDNRLLNTHHSKKDEIEKLVEISDEVTKIYDKFFVLYIQRQELDLANADIIEKRYTASQSTERSVTHEKRKDHDNDSSNDYTP